MFAVYSSGQADAVMTLGPFSLPILEKTRPSRAFDAADYGINLPALGLVTREDVISIQDIITEFFRGQHARTQRSG